MSKKFDFELIYFTATMSTCSAVKPIPFKIAKIAQIDMIQHDAPVMALKLRKQSTYKGHAAWDKGEGERVKTTLQNHAYTFM